MKENYESSHPDDRNTRLRPILDETIDADFLEAYIDDTESGIYEDINEHELDYIEGGLIHQYEKLFLTDEYEPKCTLSHDQYEEIFEITLLKKDTTLDTKTVVLGLRILFYSADSLPTFTDAYFNEILDKILDLIETGEEPMKIHAIKCLQIFVYNNKRLDAYNSRLRKLFDTLIKNLMRCIIYDDDDLIYSVPPSKDPLNDLVDEFERMFIHMPKIDKRKLCVPHISIKDFVDIGTISTANQQKFHNMTLIYCLIKIFKPDELIANERLFTLLYCCLHVIKVRSDVVVSLALEIIYKLFDDSMMYYKFIGDDILYRVLSVPYYLTSSNYVVRVLFKISKDALLLDDIFENDPNVVKTIIDYILQALTCFFDDTSTAALINFLKYSSFDDLNEIGGLQTITREFRRIEFCKKSKIKCKKYSADINRLFTVYFNQILTFCIFVRTYFVKYIYSQVPTLFEAAKDPVNKLETDDQFCDTLLQKLEETGFIGEPEPSISVQINHDLFEVIHIIYRSIQQIPAQEKTIYVYQLLNQIINFCLYIKDISELFVEKFKYTFTSRLPDQNMISILLKFLEALDFKHDWIYFLPYQTINNLLSRCFLSFESYQKYVTDNKRAYIPETGKKFEFLTFGSDKIIEQLVARSFIIHSINCLKNNMASQISIRHIIYLIQSLIALTADKTFIYLLSINKKFFSEAFQKYLIDTCSKNPDNPQIGTLLKCAEILRTKVNKDFNKTYSLELEELLSKSKKRKSDDSQN